MKIKAYYDKGSKRLKKILGRIFPKNTEYRPGGICRVDPENGEANNPREITVHPVYLNHVTTLSISEELYQACCSYWKPKYEVKTDYMVLEVPNGRIYTDNESSVAVVSLYNRVVENVSLSLVEGKVTAPNLNNIFEQRYFSVPRKYNGTVFSMLTGGAGINNIGHWFIDVLPRLHLLRQSGVYDKVDWFYVPGMRYSFQLETLELLGIPKAKLISGEENPHISADCIIASTAPRGNHTLVPKWLSEFIQHSFMPLANEPESELLEAPYLYISRSDSGIRNVLNEDKLLKALEPLGFKTVVSSKLSIEEKIRLFSQAKVIVGATGAGLINMFFCQPGTKMVEIFNENYVIEPFYDIAGKIGLDYYYVICKSTNGKATNATQGQHEHLTVDVDRVLETVTKLVKGKERQQAQVA